jgi:hypothetical protein
VFQAKGLHMAWFSLFGFTTSKGEPQTAEGQGQAAD